MKKANLWMALAGLGVLLAVTLTAQPQTGENREERQNLRNIDWQNMSPQDIQKMIRQRLLESFRDRLEVTDDAEWRIISERLERVSQARMETLAGDFGMGGFGGRPGSGGGRGLQALLGEPSAEAKALQSAIDAKAPSAEIKEKLAKLREFRKQKQAELAKAQDDLRKVLSQRQEAIVVLAGLLE